MPVGVQLSLDVGWGKKNQRAGGKKRRGEAQLTEAVAAASTAAILSKWLEKERHIQ